MIYLITKNNPLIEYNNGEETGQGVIFRDKYCTNSQFIFQPTKKLIGPIHIASGKSFRTWDSCLKEI